VQIVFSQVPEYKWMYHKPYGSTVELEPLFNQTNCNSQTECYWLLPDKITKYSYSSKENIPQKYSISPNGILIIKDIQSSDNGIYHFFQKNNSQWVVSKALLNLHGAPYPTVWSEYWPNVIETISIVKSFCFFFVFLLGRRWYCCNGRYKQGHLLIIIDLLIVIFLVILITFTFILIINKYRYRSPSSTTHSKRPGTVEPIAIERANPGKLKEKKKQQQH